MKKIIILLLLVLISCGKESSVNDPYYRDSYVPHTPWNPQLPNYEGFVPTEGWKVGYPSQYDPLLNWYDLTYFNSFRSSILNGAIKNWYTHSYWDPFPKIYFFYVRYNCTNMNMGLDWFLNWTVQQCNYETVNEDGKNYYNMYAQTSSLYKHPFGNGYDSIDSGFINLFTKYTGSILPSAGYSYNGLKYWLIPYDKDTTYGINPSYPVWANPVFTQINHGLDPVSGFAHISGYYLSHWIYY